MDSNPHGKYISHVTGNPNKNRSYFFTCPIAEEYGLGVKAGHERYMSLQDWKKSIRQAITKLLLEKTISTEEATDLENNAFAKLEEARKSEKNKEKINPLWTQWNEENKEPSKKGKKGGGKTIGELMKENYSLKELLEEKERENEALKKRVEEQNKLMEKAMAYIENMKKQFRLKLKLKKKKEESQEVPVNKEESQEEP